MWLRGFQLTPGECHSVRCTDVALARGEGVSVRPRGVRSCSWRSSHERRVMVVESERRADCGAQSAEARGGLHGTTAVHVACHPSPLHISTRRDSWSALLVVAVVRCAAARRRYNGGAGPARRGDPTRTERSKRELATLVISSGLSARRSTRISSRLKKLSRVFVCTSLASASPLRSTVYRQGSYLPAQHSLRWTLAVWL